MYGPALLQILSPPKFNSIHKQPGHGDSTDLDTAVWPEGCTTKFVYDKTDPSTHRNGNGDLGILTAHQRQAAASMGGHCTWQARTSSAT
jgi:hypothetical protein